MHRGFTAIFAKASKHRPRINLTIRQRRRVLNGARRDEPRRKAHIWGLVFGPVPPLFSLERRATLDALGVRRTPVEAERRQVTVVFADTVGFTSFSERSGEEAAYTLMRSLSKLMDEAVREQGGVVQSFTGDGIMAVFGAPVAFEDAPLRACRAALAILQRLKTAGRDLEVKHGMKPQLRIGLNTGAAVVGKVQQGVEAQITVLGDTVNFASRLQALAQPDSIFLSETTHRLVQGRRRSFGLTLSVLGPHDLKLL
jgi:class 3 adenylate cyclase